MCAAARSAATARMKTAIEGPQQNAAGATRKIKAEHAYGYDEGIVHDLGEILRFAGRLARAMPRSLRYLSEVFRQTGILILDSSAVILLMEAIIASEATLKATYSSIRVSSSPWCPSG